MDNCVDKQQKQEKSLIDGVETDVNQLASYVAASTRNRAQPAKCRDYLINFENIETLLRQLILKLRSDVDKLWISDQKDDESCDRMSFDDTVTIELQKKIWGEKETVLSSLIKLVGLLDKVLAVEKEITRLQISENEEKPDDAPLTQEDQAIIERYFFLNP